MAALKLCILSLRKKWLVLCALFLVLNLSFLYFASVRQGVPCDQLPTPDAVVTEPPRIVTLKQAKVKLPSASHNAYRAARPRLLPALSWDAPTPHIDLPQAAAVSQPFDLLLMVSTVDDAVESYVEDVRRSAVGRSVELIVVFTSETGMERCRSSNPGFAQCRESSDKQPSVADALLYLRVNNYDTDRLVALVDDAGIDQGAAALQNICMSFAQIPAAAQTRPMLVGAHGFVRQQLQHLSPSPSRLFASDTVSTPFIGQVGSLLKFPPDLGSVTPTALLAAVADVPAFSASLSPISQIAELATHDVVTDLLWARLLRSGRQRMFCTEEEVAGDACHPVVLLLDHSQTYSVADQARQLKPLLSAFLEQRTYKVVVVATSHEGDLVGEAKCWEVLSAIGASYSAPSLCSHVYTMAFDEVARQDLQYLHVPASKESMCEVLQAIGADAVVRAVHEETNHPHVLPGLEACTPYAVVEIPHNEVEHAVWLPLLHYNGIRNWNTPKLTASIIANTRPRSLQRLLGSLEHGIFLGDSLDISFNMDAGADDETLQISQDFEWHRGKKLIRHRVVKGGLIAAVTESWFPSHDDEWNFFLEDDISLSPYFYIWAKYALLMYQYGGPEDALPDFMGVSLYTPRMIETAQQRFNVDLPKDMKRITGHAYTPYLDQVPCSWGVLYSPRVWKKFRTYLRSRLADGTSVKMNIPNSRINGWKGSWKKYLMEMTYAKGIYMLYPNFENQESFATNHLEPGEHVQQANSKTVHLPEDFTVPIMASNQILAQLPNNRLPKAVGLPRYNIVHDLVYKPRRTR